MKFFSNQISRNFTRSLIPLLLSLSLLASCGLTTMRTQSSKTTPAPSESSIAATTAAVSSELLTTSSAPSTAAPSSSQTSPNTLATTSAGSSSTPQAADLKIMLKEQKAQFVVVDGQVLQDAPYAESLLQIPFVETTDVSLRQTLQNHIDDLYAVQLQNWDKFKQESAASQSAKGNYRNILISRTKLSEDKDFYYLMNELMYGFYQSEGTAPRYFNLVIDRSNGQILSFEEVLKRRGLKRSEVLRHANDYVLQNKLDTQGKAIKGEEINAERVFFNSEGIFMLISVFSDFRGELMDELHQIWSIKD